MEICLNWIPRRTAEGAKEGSSPFSSEGREQAQGPSPGGGGNLAGEGDSPSLKRGVLVGGGGCFQAVVGLGPGIERVNPPQKSVSPHTAGTLCQTL